MDIHQFLAEHGAWLYPSVFVWTFFEGETLVLFAGVAVAQGLIDPAALIAAAWLGSFCGDQCYFLVGRRGGHALLRRFPHWRHSADIALQWLERYDAGFILTFRFVYGVRNISSFALGLSAVRWRRFLWLNFAAAGLWALTFVGVGYFLGHAFRAVLGDLARWSGLAMLGLLVLVATAMWLLHRARRRRQLRVPPGAKPVLPPS